MIKIDWITCENVPNIWELVAPMLDRALKRGLPVTNIEDIYTQIMAEYSQLWVIFDPEAQKIYGAAVTTVKEYPRDRVLLIHLLGGNNIHKWSKDFDIKMTEFAKAEECSFIESYSRKGWQRIFADTLSLYEVIIKVVA